MGKGSKKSNHISRGLALLFILVGIGLFLGFFFSSTYKGEKKKSGRRIFLSFFLYFDFFFF